MEEAKEPLVKTNEEVRKYSFTAKQVLVAGILLFVIIAALFIWRIVQANKVKDEYINQVKNVKQQARAVQMEGATRQLKLLAKPYTWAVRSSLLQSNLTQVNEYANDIVTEKNVVSVMFVDTKNTVISSTNKKYEGKDYLSFGPAYYLNTDSAVVNKLNDSVLVLASPVMSFNNKLGTIIFSYAVPAPTFTDSVGR